MYQFCGALNNITTGIGVIPTPLVFTIIIILLVYLPLLYYLINRGHIYSIGCKLICIDLTTDPYGMHFSKNYQRGNHVTMHVMCVCIRIGGIELSRFCEDL